ASLLHDLAARLQAAAGVTGESYPNNHDLRLPLMPHLRAPGGAARYPLLLPGGQLVDTADPWLALAELRAAWHTNPLSAVTSALATLPALSPTNRQPLHKSHVNPLSSASVIGWYNDHYSVEDLLSSAGATGRGHVLRCPWHDDRTPSL